MTKPLTREEVEARASVSGKPSRMGIEDLIAMLDREAALVAEWHELKPKADRLVSVESLLSDTRRDIAKSLQAMDIEGGGNAGWTDRMAWALAEMRRQVREALGVEK